MIRVCYLLLPLPLWCQSESYSSAWSSFEVSLICIEFLWANLWYYNIHIKCFRCGKEHYRIRWKLSYTHVWSLTSYKETSLASMAQQLNLLHYSLLYVEPKKVQIIEAAWDGGCRGWELGETWSSEEIGWCLSEQTFPSGSYGWEI